MRLAIYIPIRYASFHDPAPGFVSFTQFQKRLARAAGGFTVTQAGGYSQGKDGYAAEPVMILEALVVNGCTMMGCHTYADTWAILREYAHQLVALGEDRVLIVQDNEPTWIAHAKPPARRSDAPDPFESLDTSEREATEYGWQG